MTDDVDRASAWEQQWRADVLRNHALKTAPRGESLENCEDCDERIPQERRDLVPGCRRCVPCQVRAEFGGSP